MKKKEVFWSLTILDVIVCTSILILFVILCYRGWLPRTDREWWSNPQTFFLLIESINSPPLRMSKIPKKMASTSSLQKLAPPKQATPRTDPKKRPIPPASSPTKAPVPSTPRAQTNSSSTLTKSSTVGNLQNSHPVHPTPHQPSNLSTSSTSTSLHKTTPTPSHPSSTHTSTTSAVHAKPSHRPPKPVSIAVAHKPTR